MIIDLNNPRTDPLGIVADMKGDPALASIPTVGFVSHVQTELIEAARQAGVSDVMARSMFAERLPQILAKGCKRLGRPEGCPAASVASPPHTTATTTIAASTITQPTSPIPPFLIGTGDGGGRTSVRLSTASAAARRSAAAVAGEL